MRLSKRAVGSTVEANAIACVSPPAAGAGPAGGEGGSRDRGGDSGPGERATAWWWLGAAPSDDRRAVGARFDGAAEVGRRGVVSFRLQNVHRHAADAYRRARFGVGVDDDAIRRVDVYVRPSESRQGGDGKTIVMAMAPTGVPAEAKTVRKDFAHAAATLASRVW